MSLIAAGPSGVGESDEFVVDPEEFSREEGAAAAAGCLADECVVDRSAGDADRSAAFQEGSGLAGGEPAEFGEGVRDDARRCRPVDGELAGHSREHGVGLEGGMAGQRRAPSDDGTSAGVVGGVARVERGDGHARVGGVPVSVDRHRATVGRRRR